MSSQKIKYIQKYYFLILIIGLILFSSFTSSAQSTLTISKIVNCNLFDTWNKWTTPTGLCTFLGEDAVVELKLNGKFEIHNSLLDINSSDGKILSYIPNEMLSFTWNPPSRFKHLKSKNTPIWVVVYFDAINDNMTRVSICQTGFHKSPTWLAYHKNATLTWKYILEQLTFSCGK